MPPRINRTLNARQSLTRSHDRATRHDHSAALSEWIARQPPIPAPNESDVALLQRAVSKQAKTAHTKRRINTARPPGGTHKRAHNSGSTLTNTGNQEMVRFNPTASIVSMPAAAPANTSDDNLPTEDRGSEPEQPPEILFTPMNPYYPKDTAVRDITSPIAATDRNQSPNPSRQVIRKQQSAYLRAVKLQQIERGQQWNPF